MQRRAFILGLATATSAMAITRTAVAQSERSAAIPTAAYLTMAGQGGQFLEETARTGFEKVSDPRLKTFSRAEVIEQVNLAEKLNGAAAAEGVASAGASDLPPVGGAPRGPIAGLVTAPVAVAGGVLGAAGGVVGGVLGGPAMTTPAQKAETVARLQALPPGPQFDATFVQVQLMGHREAKMIHGDYARRGSDPALRRIARNAIPLIDQHIAFLSRAQARMGV